MSEQGRVVLVTGGTGFVGSHVVDALLRAGFRARCSVRPTSNQRWLAGKPIDLVQADLRLPDQLEPAIAGVDAIIHCAGLTRGSRDALMSANRDGTRALVQACQTTGRRIRFVFCSSQAAAGPGWLDRPRQASDPPAPATDYGESKLAAEAVVAKAEDLDAVVLRPVAVYGPRDEDTLTFFKLATRGIIVTPGLRRRVVQLVHVRDLASALIKAVDRPQRSGDVFCIAHPEVVDWDQLAVAMREATGRNAITLRVPSFALQMIGAAAELVGGAGLPGRIDRRKAADMSERAWTCDADRAIEELDWSPTYNTRDGFRDSVNWYRQEGWL
jgi:nucleoside-diphosphate-sugar epimerase